MTDINAVWASDDSIAHKQREIAEDELRRMRQGKSVPVFDALGVLLRRIRLEAQHVTILDAGCGSGHYHDVIEYNVPGWATYTGVDYNAGMVKLAQELYPDLGFFQFDLRQLPWGDQSFDIVLTGATVNSIMDWQAAMQGLARLARRWFILHRATVTHGEPTRESYGDAYGLNVLYWRWNEADVLETMAAAGFSRSDTVTIDKGQDHDCCSYLFERVAE